MKATHGTRSQYNKGCRCVECVEAKRAYSREYAARKAAGTTTAQSVPATAPPAPPVPAVPGPMEVAVLARLDEIIIDVPGAEVWREQATMVARLLDSLASRNIAVGVNGLLASLSAALDRLQPPVAQRPAWQGGGPVDDIARGFGTDQAALDAWAADL